MADHTKGKWAETETIKEKQLNLDIYMSKTANDTRQTEQVEFLLKNVKNRADYNDHELSYIRRVFNHTISKLRATNPNYVDKLIRTVCRLLNFY